MLRLRAFGIHLVAMKQEVSLFAERNRSGARKQNAVARANLLQLRLDAFRINRGRLFAREAKQHSAVRPVATPCKRKRTKKFSADANRMLQLPRFRKPGNKAPRRA